MPPRSKSARQQSLPLSAASTTEIPPPSPAASAEPPLFGPPLTVRTSLGSVPELTSCNELAEALRCVGLVDARRKSIESTRDAAVADLNEQAAQAMHVHVDGLLLTFDEWRQRLIAAIEQFVPDRKPEVFAGETQTAKFPAGTVAWKRVEPAVRLADDVRKEDLAERLAARKKFPEAVAALLKRLGLDGWLRVEVKLDLAAIQQRFRDGQLKAKQLPAGLVVAPQSEAIIVKPLPQPERSDVAA